MKNISELGKAVTGSKLLATYFGDLNRVREDFSLEQSNLFMRALRHAGLSEDLLRATIDEGKKEKSNHFANAAVWSLLKQRFPVAQDEERAFEIMGDNFFPSLFNRSFLNLGKKEKAPTIRFSKKTLEDCRENHILVLGPCFKKGKDTALGTIVEEGYARWFFWNDDQGIRSRLSSLREIVPYEWLLLSKELASEPNVPGYEIPSAAIVAWAIKIRYLYLELHLNLDTNKALQPFEGRRLECKDTTLSIREGAGDMGSYGPEIGVWVDRDDYDIPNVQKSYARPRPTEGLGIKNPAYPLLRNPDF